MSPVSLENKSLPLSLDLILYFIIETIMGGGIVDCCKNTKYNSFKLIIKADMVYKNQQNE